MTRPTDAAARAGVCDALRRADRFIVTSHVRPDGDAVGSSMAMALALRAMGKSARVVLRDRLPAPYPEFPRTGEIEFAESVADDGATVVVMECGDLERTGLSGLESHPVINIDHHPGNSGFGEVQWFDGTAAACAEMVAEIIEGLGVTVSPDMAMHLYVAIVTDTGSFRYPGVSPRTFRICATLVEAGADPVAVSRLLFDGHTMGRLKLQAAVLGTLDILHDGTVATLRVDPETMAAAGATADDTDGIINIPLMVRHLNAVALFKRGDNGSYRVSLRSKGAIDVGRIARGFGGGGHKNAAGCTLTGSFDDIRSRILDLLVTEVDAAGAAHARG
jgi:bifunctional oligoribonuclease and PAP phosphatase NrnA